MNQGPYGGPPSNQGYGGSPPHQQQQGYPQRGYPQQGGYPQGPPPEKRIGTGAIIAIVLGGAFVVFGGSCAVCVAIGARSAAAPVAVDPTGGTPTGTRQQSMVVDINTLLGDYKANEVRADGTYEDHVVQTSGKVSEIKKDIVDDMYVTVGTGKQFEIPEVQCTLKSANKAKAAALSKGQMVTVRGKVTGLLMNVQLDDCDIS